MKIIEKKENQISFVSDVEDSLANAIRKYINTVPVLAIDEIEISRNDSPLYDETIAHRIGLIPLRTTKEVEKKNPKIKLSSKGSGFVYSKELKGADVVYENTPITFLGKGQEMEIKGVTKMGKGTEHSKFSPGMMFYRPVSEITLDKNVYNGIKNSISGNEVKEKGDKVILTDNRAKEIADVCEGAAIKMGKNAEINLRDELLITLESFGQLSVQEIFKKSIGELKKDLNEVSKKMGK